MQGAYGIKGANSRLYGTLGSNNIASKTRLWCVGLQPLQQSRFWASEIQASVTSVQETIPLEAIRVKRCNAQDAPTVAMICSEVFGSGKFPGIEHPLVELVEELVRKDVEEKLTKALAAKLEVANGLWFPQGTSLWSSAH